MLAVEKIMQFAIHTHLSTYPDAVRRTCAPFDAALRDTDDEAAVAEGGGGVAADRGRAAAVIPVIPLEVCDSFGPWSHDKPFNGEFGPELVTALPHACVHTYTHTPRSKEESTTSARPPRGDTGARD